MKYNTILRSSLEMYLMCFKVVQLIEMVGDGLVVRWCWLIFQCRGVLLILIRVGLGATALAVGVGGRGCLVGHFSLVYHFSFLSPSLWETA